MIFSKASNKKNINFTINSKIIDITKEFKYLGITISSKNCTFTPTLSDISSKANKAIYSLLSKLPIKLTPVKTMLKLFDCCIVPILPYGSEVWAPFMNLVWKQWNTTQIDKIHTQFLKRLLGVNRSTTNVLIRSEVGRHSLQEQILARNINYIKYIENKDPPSLVKQAANYEIHYIDERNSYIYIYIYIYIYYIFSRNGTTFETSIYRKPTFSGVFTNFTSYIDARFKRGLLYTFLHRSFVICCNYEKLHQEIIYLKSIFQRNAYPLYFIDKCIRVFLDKLFIKKQVSYDVPKKIVTIIIPYMGRLSLEIRTRLRNVISKGVPNCQLRVITRSTRRLGNVFPFKDMVPNALRSYVVYKFKCKDCNALYYGKSNRHFHHRACEPPNGEKIQDPKGFCDFRPFTTNWS